MLDCFEDARVQLGHDEDEVSYILCTHENSGRNDASECGLSMIFALLFVVVSKALLMSERSRQSATLLNHNGWGAKCDSGSLRLFVGADASDDAGETTTKGYRIHDILTNQSM